MNLEMIRQKRLTNDINVLLVKNDHVIAMHTLNCIYARVRYHGPDSLVYGNKFIHSYMTPDISLYNIYVLHVYDCGTEM